MGVAIGDRRVGEDEPMYVVAEAGANHDGEVGKAHELVEAAAESGADAVKFQNYTAERLVTRDAKKWWGDTSTTQYETYARLDALTREDYEAVAAHAENLDIPFFSTPFDAEAVDLLDQLDVPAYKVASGDLTHHPLLEYVASRGKPVILSTGMATMDEVREAVDVIESTGNDGIVLLHCISVYPTPVDRINLRMMEDLMEEFDHPVGLSDHTEGVTVPIAAAAMGAAVLEKHFTFDTSLDESPDHRLSADVEEMREIVERTRDVHAAMGESTKHPIDLEQETREKARRSVVAERRFEAGEPIDPEGLAVKRPGTGIAPKHLRGADGWRAATAIEPDQVLTWDDVETDG